MPQVIKTTFQLRCGLEATWKKNNPVLASGEPSFVIDRNYLKIGDGKTYWNDLKPIGLEQNEISLLTDDKSIIIIDNQISIKGFKEALPGAQPIKGEDGILTWVVPSTTVEKVKQTYETKEVADNLGALAAKNSASGIVAGETIAGVKATGTSTGSINVVLTESEANITSTGSYTPAGSVDGGKVTAAGEVKITITNAEAQASLSTTDYQPAGDVSVTLSNNEINAVKSVGTQASFKEGAFTPAALDHAEVNANYVEEGLVGVVEDETLTFTAAAVKALSASKVNSFSGGAKAADIFVANELPVAEVKTVGIQAATFEGTVAAGLKVTGVTYQTHNVDSATFTGSEVAVTGASFSGNTATIEVAGKGKSYAVDAANTKFNGVAIELDVGDIVVAEKNVTVQ